MPILVRSLAAAAAFALGVSVTGDAAAQQRQAAPAVRDRVDHPTAQFAGLDKITGRIITFEVRVGETVQFGALQVTPRACAERLTGERHRVAFVEVDEITLRNEIRRIFAGWMFASSPGLNAIEHPIYDVWLAACTGGQAPQIAAGPRTGYQGEGEPAVEGETPPPRRTPRPQQRQQQPPPPGGQPPPAQQRIQPGVPFDPAQVPRR